MLTNAEVLELVQQSQAARRKREKEREKDRDRDREREKDRRAEFRARDYVENRVSRGRNDKYYTSVYYTYYCNDI